MKKFTKISLAVSGLCVVSGIALCITGFVLGYEPGSIWGYYKEKSESVRNGTHDFSASQEYEDIEVIKVSVGAADCQIQSYQGDYVKVEADPYRLLECEEDGHDLEISYGEDDSLIHLLGKNDVGYIRILVPEDRELEMLKIEGGASQVTMENLSCRELDMEVGAGAFSYSGTVEKKIAVDCGVGSTELKLKGQTKDFDYQLECGLGSIAVEDGPSIAGAGETKVDNGADKEMKLECGLGSISVSFSE